MTVKQKDKVPEIHYLQIALNICEIPAPYPTAELIKFINDYVQKKKGKADIEGLSKIKSDWQKYWDEYQKKNKDDR